MNRNTYLLLIIVMMHVVSLTNMTMFSNNYNGIVMAVNTFLFVLAFAVVLPLKGKLDHE